MKRVLFFSLLFLPTLHLLIAQEAAPFEFNDDQAMTLDKDVLKNLINKTWSSYKQYIVLGEERKEYGGGFLTFTLKNDHTYQAAGIGDRYNKGTWDVKKRTLLHLKMINEQPADQEKAMGGSYVIYSIKNEELVLVKNLTSDLKAKIIYHCKVIESKDLAARPAKNRQEPIMDTKINIPSPLQVKMTESMTLEELSSQIKEELFVRGLQPPANFSKWKQEALLELYKNIINGNYKG